MKFFLVINEFNLLMEHFSPSQYFWKKSHYQILITILFALATGHAWHIRGSGPWGGMIGMFAVGTIVVGLIYVFFGDRVKAKPVWAGLLTIFMGITVSGWGTLNSQITGRLYGGSLYDIPVNPLSGIFYLFLVGFGWAPLFGFALGYFMGSRKYSRTEFLLGIVTFYLADFCAMLLIAHLIIPVTAPETYQLFAEALQSRVNNSPWQYYLQNFFNTSDFEQIAGGRNYVSMVSNFAQAFGAITLWVLVRFKFKDPQGAKYTIAIPLVIGTSIVLADLWMFWAAGCFYSFSMHAYTCTPPTWLAGNGWGMWEYFTGFGFGMGLALLLLHEDPAYYAHAASIPDSVIPPKLNRLFTFVGFICVMLFGSVFLPLRSALEQRNLQPWDIILPGIGLVAIIIITFTLGKGKIHLPQWSGKWYALLLLISYWITYFAIDQFLTLHTTPDWRRIQDYLDIISIVVGIPLVLLLSWLSANPSRNSPNR